MASSTKSTRVHSPWYVAVVAGMASYLDAAAIVSTGTALVLYQDVFDLDGARIGQLSALLTITIALGALVGGRAGDRYGRRRVFSITMIVFALGAVLLATAGGLPMLAVGVALLGFAAGADLPVSIATISEAAPPGQRGTFVSFSHVLWILGIIAAQVLGILVGGMGELGARILYGHLAVVSVVVLILRFGIAESAEWIRSREAVTKENGGWRDGLREAFAVVSTPAYRTPVIAVSLFYAIVNIAANTNGQFNTYLFVNVAGSDVSTASTFGLLTFGAGFIGLFVLMRVVDTRFRMAAFIVAASLTVFAFLVPATAGVTVVALVVMGLIYSLGGNIAGEPMFKVWSQELVPTEVRSSAQGVMIAFTRVVAAILALFTPLILDSGPQVLFFFLAGTSLVASLIGILWIARLPRLAETSAVTSADPESVRLPGRAR